MSDHDEVRERGKAQMRAVYGWDIEPTKPFETSTVDHLFGEVWAEGKLSVRDRRLVLIGLAAGTGLEDVAGLQLDAAMNLGELDADDLRDPGGVPRPLRRLAPCRQAQQRGRDPHHPARGGRREGRGAGRHRSGPTS